MFILGFMQAELLFTAYINFILFLYDLKVLDWDFLIRKVI